MDASRRPSWSSTALPPLSAQLLNFFSFQTNGPHLKPIPAGVLRAAFITCVPWLLYSHFHLYFCSVPQKRLQDMEKHRGLYCASSQAKKCSQKCLDKENNLPSFFFSFTETRQLLLSLLGFLGVSLEQSPLPMGCPALATARTSQSPSGLRRARNIPGMLHEGLRRKESFKP